MIESLIFLALGVLLAVLAGLLALPAITQRAWRLSEARARLNAPLTRSEAIAERDQLRAQHAVELHRLELRMVKFEDATAELRAKMGRQTTKIFALEEQQKSNMAMIATQDDRIATLRQREGGLEAEISAHQLLEVSMRDDIARASAAQEKLQERFDSLETLSDQRRVEVATLQTTASGFGMTIDSLEVDRARLTRSLSEKTVEAVNLAQALASASRKIDNHSADMIQNQNELVTTRRRVGELESKFSSSEGARESLLREVARLIELLGERDDAIGQAQKTSQVLRAQLEATVASGKAREDSAELQAQIMTTNLAKLEGALNVARSDRASLQHELEQLKSANFVADDSALKQLRKSDGDRALRKAIAKLGAEVLSLADARPAAVLDLRGGSEQEGLDAQSNQNEIKELPHNVARPQKLQPAAGGR